MRELSAARKMRARGAVEGARGRTHEPTEPLEGAGNTDMGVDLDEDALGGVDVHLEEASLVERRVEEGQEALRRARSRSSPCPGKR